MFFSVKETLIINGHKYRSCVSYEANEGLFPTLAKLELEGKVTLYDENKFFVNGKPWESKPKPKSKPKDN